MALGVSNGFSLRQAVAGGLTAGIGAGLGALGAGNLFGSNWANAATSAALNTVGGYAANRIAGIENTHFSWRSVAANAITAGITASIAPGLGGRLGFDQKTLVGQFRQDVLNGAIGGVIGLHTRRALGVGAAVDYGQIAVDAFGNAIANVLNGESQRRAHAADPDFQRQQQLIREELVERGELGSPLFSPWEPNAHDDLWNRLPEDGSLVMVGYREGQFSDGRGWSETDYARRINDNYERQRYGGARVYFGTLSIQAVLDVEQSQVINLMPPAPRAEGNGWSIGQEIALAGARGTGAVVGVGKSLYDGVVGTLSTATDFASSAMYLTGFSGFLDRTLGGSTFSDAHLAAADRLGGGIAGAVDFVGSDHKGTIVADHVFGRFDRAVERLSSNDLGEAFGGAIDLGQLTGDVGFAVAGGIQTGRSVVQMGGKIGGAMSRITTRVIDNGPILPHSTTFGIASGVPGFGKLTGNVLKAVVDEVKGVPASSQLLGKMPGIDGVAKQVVNLQERRFYNRATRQPEANTIYRYNNLVFETDGLGRGISTRGKISSVPGDRSYLDKRIGAEGKRNDIGFHGMAAVMGAPGGRLNVFPGNKFLNNKEFKVLENRLRKYHDEGNEVLVDVQRVFEPGNVTTRPDRIIVQYRVGPDGVIMTERFRNRKGG